jgi:hypothetical protein
MSNSALVQPDDAEEGAPAADVVERGDRLCRGRRVAVEVAQHSAPMRARDVTAAIAPRMVVASHALAPSSMPPPPWRS